MHAGGTDVRAFGEGRCGQWAVLPAPNTVDRRVARESGRIVDRHPAGPHVRSTAGKMCLDEGVDGGAGDRRQITALAGERQPGRGCLGGGPRNIGGRDVLVVVAGGRQIRNPGLVPRDRHRHRCRARRSAVGQRERRKPRLHGGLIADKREARAAEGAIAVGEGQPRCLGHRQATDGRRDRHEQRLAGVRVAGDRRSGQHRGGVGVHRRDRCGRHDWVIGQRCGSRDQAHEREAKHASCQPAACPYHHPTRCFHCGLPLDGQSSRDGASAVSRRALAVVTRNTERKALRRRASRRWPRVTSGWLRAGRRRDHAVARELLVKARPIRPSRCGSSPRSAGTGPRPARAAG